MDRHGRSHSPIPPPREPRLGGSGPMRGNRRGGGDLPPPPPLRGGSFGGDRRRRSISPRGRRSPPPAKRYRREEEDDRGYRNPSSPMGGGRSRSGPYGSRHDGGSDREFRYDPVPPPPRPKTRPDGEPLTFKEFLMRLEDDVTPEEAQQRYQLHQAQVYGSVLKAEWKRNKNQDSLKSLYDPRTFESLLEKRNASAQEASRLFAEELSEGKLDPSAEGFNQGAFDLPGRPILPPPGAADKDKDKDKAKETVKESAGFPDSWGPEPGAEPKVEPKVEPKAEPPAVAPKPAAPPPPAEAPTAAWRPARVAHDLQVSRLLIAHLDPEKGIESNPLLLVLPTKAEEKKKAEENEGGDHAMAEAEAEPAAKDKETEEAKDKEKEAAAKSDDKPDGKSDAKLAVPEGAEALAAALAKLDLCLTYLWRVHGLDYYGGAELPAGQRFAERLQFRRTLRGAPPEEGEGEDLEGQEGAAAPKDKGLKAMDSIVDTPWKRRLGRGDNLLVKCQREEVEERLTKWVKSQIIKHTEQKWGNKLSTKMFLEEKYVIKHIRTKHEPALAKARNEIYDEIYFENFESVKLAEQEAKRQRAAELRGANAAEMENGGGQPYEYMQEDYGMSAYAAGFQPAFGLDMGGGGMVMAPPMMSAGPMLIPAPGAGPMGPFIPVHAGMHMGGMEPVNMMPYAPSMPPAARGPPSYGPPGGGGPPPAPYMPGAKLDPRGIREYYDLDAPQNNRAVLDYGDL